MLVVIDVFLFEVRVKTLLKSGPRFIWNFKVQNKEWFLLGVAIFAPTYVEGSAQDTSKDVTDDTWLENLLSIGLLACQFFNSKVLCPIVFTLDILDLLLLASLLLNIKLLEFFMDLIKHVYEEITGILLL